MNMIELRKVNKSFGNHHVIKDLSFRVEEGTITSLMGDSGSGKSTLLNMIGLLEKVDGGEIRIRGKKIPKINSKKAVLFRRNCINYLFQSFALITDMSVKENLKIAMNFMKLNHKEKDAKIKNILEQLNMERRINQKINTLSGGEQQRVALARGILKPGNLILADEPTGSLDEKMSETVFDILKNVRDEYKKTILIVTHDPKIGEAADQMIRLPSQF
ncbi:MAG: ATP-binding cassette domain-containing protein [Tissierellia bacterium]|nr:ATP-binding cassette domain-containing protein [Tissierellia bacterium]